MEFQDEDQICFKSHYFLDEKIEQKLSEINKSASSTTNKEQVTGLLTRADTLAYKAYLPNSRWLVNFNLPQTRI